MSSKKYILFIGLLFLLTSGVYAQVGTNYDVLDSSLVPKKSLPQHNEFVNNAYPFPAKPRNQWELGIKAGAFTISGDVRNRFPGFGAALHVRKALGYVFSIRGEVGYGTTRGLNFQPSVGYTNPRSPWSRAGYTTEPVFYNYKTDVGDLSLQGVVTLNNIRFHKAKTGFNAYAFAGIGAMIYNVNVDALNGTTRYDFTNALSQFGPDFPYEDRRDIKKELKDNVFDGEYETDGEKDQSQPELFGTAFKPTFSLGIGLQFKLSKRISLAIEDKFTFVKTDLLDGQQYQNIQNLSIQTRDYDAYNFLSLGLNFALGGKAVEPLWWVNPLDYAYNELNAPKHMKLPKPILDDADGDGITDQFDLEPNTPAGAPVDAHGVSRDSDGDGVPDFRDKELITPTQWQPVDADGVGKAPDPACCTTIDSLLKSGSFRGGCGIGDLPSISFSGRSVALSNDAKAVLATVATTIRNSPNCKIAVIGYGESSKSAQQLSWDRVNSVINYLVEKEGIGSDRFVFKYGEGGGDPNTVDLRDGTGEEGPNTVPAPHPNLRKK
ncbi:MAG: OmpA family protein [Chitinophagaceae bacterium]|nr:OmpA family protein [Chitinophagaceae bacterium]